MEVYVLDSLLRRQQVVDRFESLIWTERFKDAGDFELVIHSNRTSRGQFTKGTKLAVNTSFRVMTVETVEDTTDEEGRSLLTVKGSSLESVLHDRVARNSHADLQTEKMWVLGGTPGDVARQIFNDICMLGKLSASDIIPFIQPGTIMPYSTLPESSTPVIVQLPPKTVYKAVKDICDIYDLGFRLVRNFDLSQLYFDIYAGSDRTTRQTELTPVIFSASNDNLQNTRGFESIEGSKNVAYVYSDFGSVIVYADGVPEDVDGFDRRVLLVEVTDIDEGTPDVELMLYQRGKEELAKARGFSAFDGEINQNAVHRYGIDYNLGDICELQNKDGIVSYKRVTEQIFVHDEQGERSYPTLTTDMFVAENTWLSQLGRVWEDYGVDEYWSTQ